jgi:hypothetical protein
MIITAVLGGVMTFHNPRDAGASSSNRPQNPLITRVVGRGDLTISVVSSPRGPLYTATDRSGKPLAQNLTLDELRAAHPSLHQQIEPAVAGTSDHAWAGIDRD